jgi:hypothetical protein
MPPLLRAFINKLPTHPVGAPLPDYDAFARHLRVLVLPPRPAVEDEVGGKRGGLGADASSSEWLNSINNEDDDAEAARPSSAEPGRKSGKRLLPHEKAKEEP